MTRMRETGRPGAADGDGCGFLSLAEIDALLDGRLDRDRSRRFESHVDAGCGACALLAADAEAFRDALESGASPEVRAAARRDREVVTGRIASYRGGARARPLWAVPLALAAATLIAALLVTIDWVGGPTEIALVLPDGRSVTVELMPYSSPPLVRGEPDASSIWKAAGAAYEHGRYVEAAALFAEVAAAEPDEPDPLLYRGIALLAVGRAQEALGPLHEAQLRATRQDLPDGAIRWYRAVALVRLDRIDEASEILARIVLDGGAFAEEAVELSDRLRG